MVIHYFISFIALSSAEVGLILESWYIEMVLEAFHLMKLHRWNLSFQGVGWNLFEFSNDISTYIWDLNFQLCMPIWNRGQSYWLDNGYISYWTWMLSLEYVQFRVLLEIVVFYTSSIHGGILLLLEACPKFNTEYDHSWNILNK